MQMPERSIHVPEPGRSAVAIARLRPEDFDRRDAAGIRDAALVAGLDLGDPGSLEQLIREHGRPLLVLTRRLTRTEDEARQAFALAFANAVKDVGAFDGALSLSAWLRRLAIRSALATIAARPRPEVASIDALLPVFDAGGKHVERWDTASAATPDATAAACLDQLPDEYRSIFVLRDVEGLSEVEVAGLVGVPAAVVKQRLHHARMALVTLRRRQREADRR